MEHVASFFGLKHFFYHQVYLYDLGDPFEHFSIRNYIVHETVMMLKRKELSQKELKDSVTIIQNENDKELSVLKRQLRKLHTTNQDQEQNQVLIDIFQALTKRQSKRAPRTKVIASAKKWAKLRSIKTKLA